MLVDPAGRKATLAEAQRIARPVFFGEWYETPVYQREMLPVDAVIEGPAVIEQMDTTILIEPGDRARSDVFGNLLVDIGDAA